FTYDDVADTISASVSYGVLQEDLDLNGNNIIGNGNVSFTGNLTVNGNITGDYKGSIFADDSSLMIDSVTGTFNLDGKVQNHIIPINNATAEIGSVANKFKEIYLSDNVWIGNAGIGTNGVGINLPAGSTIDGAPIGAGGAGGQQQIDIIGADSTVIINTETNTVSGLFVGDLKGTVVGDDSTILVDGVASRVYATDFDNTEIAIVANDIIGSATINLASELQDAFRFNLITDGSNPPDVSIQSQRGTLASPVNTQAGDKIANFKFGGYYDGDYLPGPVLLTTWDAGATLTNDAPASTLQIAIGDDSSSSYVYSFTGSHLKVPGAVKPGVYANPTARDAAIPSPEAGMMIFVTDSTGASGPAKFQGNTDGTVGGWVNLN
ncbi:hypothetical protein N9A25_00180, partial [bacterium]|nr:hypothetical protein [bacterium]